MQEKNILLCFLAVPLRHKIVAGTLAVAIASGFIVWARRGANRLTRTAEVSFDADEARQIEPSAMLTKEPAIVLARSILNEDAIRRIEKRTDVKIDVAKFRARLELAQPSANRLHVDFPDTDRDTSVAIANGVANLLVAWKPAPAVLPTVPVASEPASQTAESALRQSRLHPPMRASHARIGEIQKLEMQLVALDQKLAALDAKAQASASNKETSADSEQRRVLEAQLGTAQKKLDDLRLRYTDEYPDVETAKENIAGIQQQLASLRPTSSEMRQLAIVQPQSEMASNEVIQLRQERVRLVEAIAKRKRREATRPLASASSAWRAAPAQAVAPASQPRLAGIPSVHGPFTLVRLATYGEPGEWWHGVLAGILCGFLYLSSAVWRYLPIRAVATAPERLAFSRDLSAETAGLAQGGGNLASWESEIKKALAMTDIGRQEETALQHENTVMMREKAAMREDAVAGERQVNVYGPEFKGQLHYDEVSEAIREKANREPNSWMAHTERARAALAKGDYDTAINEIRLAITVAPEKLKPKLDKISAQLDRNMSMKQRAAYG
jgi:tetratricopeptide (TPR) repeat protein